MGRRKQWQVNTQRDGNNEEDGSGGDGKSDGDGDGFEMEMKTKIKIKLKENEHNGEGGDYYDDGKKENNDHDTNKCKTPMAKA